MNDQANAENALMVFSSEPVRPGFEQLLLEYVADLPKSIQQLENCFQAGCHQDCENVLHRLAGSLGMYGYRGLEGLCRALLGRIRRNEAISDVRSNLDDFLDHLGNVQARPTAAERV